MKAKFIKDILNERYDDFPNSPKWRQVRQYLVKFGMTGEQADSNIDTFIRLASYKIRERYNEEHAINIAAFIRNAAANDWHGVYESDNKNIKY